MTEATPIKRELADVLSRYGDQFRAIHKLSTHHRKVMFAIENCRSAVLGGHITKCNKCGKEQIYYNSCRNRHCPKCQQLKKQTWIEQLSARLLPVRYFHIVFTIPCELNRLCLQNQSVMYDLLFKAASQTILTLGRDPAHLGAETGLVAILHTWGQTLTEHPHLHVLVPAGGWSAINGYWKSSKKRFLFPVRTMSSLFRGKFLGALKEAYNARNLKFNGSISELISPTAFQQLVGLLYNKPWVVYAKKPFKSPASIIEYLGRYTNRVAITNDRIQTIEDGNVCFAWKDYRDRGARKVMTLAAVEFIRRFMLHVLPKGFYKIRYYGLLSSRKHKQLEEYRRLMGFKAATNRLLGLNTTQAAALVFGRDPTHCPFCGQGQLIIQKIFSFKERAP